MDLNDGAGLVKVQEETGCCGAFSGHPTAPLALTGGQRYAIMGLYKEGGGGDYMQVAAKLESDGTNPDTLRPISGTAVGTYVNGAGVSLTATTQPADQTVLIIPPTPPPAASFTFGVTAVVPGNANPPVVLPVDARRQHHPWRQRQHLQLHARSSRTTARSSSATAYTLGASVVSREALLTVAQPNTPPTFACGPNQGVAEDSGAQTVAGWATDISEPQHRGHAGSSLA